MYKKNPPHVHSFELSLRNPALYSKPLPIPTALIWSSFLRFCPLLLLIHASPKHVVSPDKRGRKGWKKRVGGLKEKIEGGKKEKEGGVQFNYHPWLVTALVGNYTTELQETALLHPIKAGTEGYTVACFLSLSCSPPWPPFFSLFHFFPYGLLPSPFPHATTSGNFV